MASIRYHLVGYTEPDPQWRAKPAIYIGAREYILIRRANGVTVIHDHSRIWWWKMTIR